MPMSSLRFLSIFGGSGLLCATLTTIWMHCALVAIGLTELPNSGWAKAHPAHSLAASLCCHKLRREGGGQKLPILRRHSLQTAPKENNSLLHSSNAQKRSKKPTTSRIRIVIFIKLKQSSTTRTTAQAFDKKNLA